MAEAYRFYRSRRKIKAPREDLAAESREWHAAEEITHIRFIGVWGTVGSLGNPLMRHNHRLGRERFHDVHSDAGGGYPQPDLSPIALNWILQKAVAFGLTLD